MYHLTTKLCRKGQCADALMMYRMRRGADRRDSPRPLSAEVMGYSAILSANKKSRD